MVKMQLTRKAYHAMVWAALIAVMVLSGCRTSWRAGSVEAPEQSRNDMTSHYHKAVEAYMVGDYKGAQDRFEMIRDDARDKTLTRMALYGLACTMLMAADTSESYSLALSVWEKWVSDAPSDLTHENPLLMAPLLKEKMLFSTIAPHRDRSDAPEYGVGDQVVSRWLLIETKSQLEQANIELREAEKGAQQNRKKINALEKEVNKLKRQIKALETIDQKIQKKKNAIPSAD